MARLLIVYGTTEGHTRKIAGRIAETVRAHGHEPTVLDSAADPLPVDLGRYDGVMVAASLHLRRHQAPVVRYVRENWAALHRVPGAFFSVSLTAVHRDEEHRAEARKCVDDFLEQTGWRPVRTFLVPGALQYSRYGFFKRLMMKLMAKRQGGDTDTSRDYEYTDWAELRDFVEEFLEAAGLPAEDSRPSAPHPA